MSGSHGFSLAFDTPGVYQLDAGGSWDSWVTLSYSGESASRTCWYVDQDVLACDAWSFQYTDLNDAYSSSGGLVVRSLTITVTAVPEPATLALWAAGLAALAAARRRRPRA